MVAVVGGVLGFLAINYKILKNLNSIETTWVRVLSKESVCVYGVLNC